MDFGVEFADRGRSDVVRSVILVDTAAQLQEGIRQELSSTFLQSGSDQWVIQLWVGQKRVVGFGELVYVSHVQTCPLMRPTRPGAGSWFGSCHVALTFSSAVAGPIHQAIADTSRNSNH